MARTAEWNVTVEADDKGHVITVTDEYGTEEVYPRNAIDYPDERISIAAVVYTAITGLVPTGPDFEVS